MPKLLSLREAVAEFIPDGASVALGLQLEQMIPFAAGHEIIRQKKRGLTLIGPISDILFDQLIGAGVRRAGDCGLGWQCDDGLGLQLPPGSRAGRDEGLQHDQLQRRAGIASRRHGSSFPAYAGLHWAAMCPKGNHFFYQVFSPFEPKGNSRWCSVRALMPDVTIVHVQRADREGNAHCWGNFGVMIEGVRAAKSVIVVAEEIVEPEVIASDPNRTVIPGFLVNAVVECPLMGRIRHRCKAITSATTPSSGSITSKRKRKTTRRPGCNRWVYGVNDRRAYMNQFGACRVESPGREAARLCGASGLRILIE